MDSDERLVERLLHGDEAAFEALYARYERPLFGFIQRYVHNAHEAEDIFHETFLSVLNDRAAAANARSVRAWLYQVARNLCLNRIRSSKRADRAFGAQNLPAETESHPEAELAVHQQHAALSSAVERLPQPLAEVYHLRARGLAYEEISSVLGVPVGTVKSRMHETVSRLRAELET